MLAILSYLLCSSPFQKDPTQYKEEKHCTERLRRIWTDTTVFLASVYYNKSCSFIKSHPWMAISSSLNLRLEIIKFPWVIESSFPKGSGPHKILIKHIYQLFILETIFCYRNAVHDTGWVRISLMHFLQLLNNRSLR